MREATLGDICQFKYGKSLPANRRLEGSFAVYGSNGAVGSHRQAITQAPTIVVGRKGSVGELHYSENPCWPIDTTYYIDPTTSDVDLRWLFHAMKSLRLTDLNKAAAIPGLNRNDAYQKRIFVPERSEQQRIAAMLDKADEIRRKREHSLSLADEVVRSSFLERFGHPLDPDGHLVRSGLGEHCDFFAGGSLPTGEEFLGQEDGLLLIKVSDLNAAGNEVAIRTAKLWTPSRSAAKGGVIAPSGSVVFPKRGGAIATNKKRVLERDCVLDPNLMAVAPKPKSNISNNYMRTWFELIDLASISSGSSVPQLNKKDLAPLAFGLPEREAVDWFDGVFERVDRIKIHLSAALAEAEALFTSVSQRAFRGEL